MNAPQTSLSANADTPRRPPGAMRLAVLTMSLVLLCRAWTMLPVYRQQLQDYLGVGDVGWGWLFSIGSSAGVFTILLAGALVDRWGPRRVLRIGILGVGSAMLLLAAAGRNWWLMAAALAINAMAAQPLVIAVNAYLIRLFPANRRRVLSLNLVAGSMGGFFFPAVAEGLLAISAAGAVSFAAMVHAPYAIIGAALLIGGVWVYRRRANGDSEHQARRWTWRDLLLPRRLVMLVGILALHGTCDTVLVVWMAKFLAGESFPAVVIAPGLIIAGHQAAYLLSRGLLAMVPEHRGRAALMIVPGLAGGAVLIAGILSRSYLLTAGGYVLGAMLWSAEFPSMLSIIAHERADRFGAAMAVQHLVAMSMVFAALTGMGYLVAWVGDAAMWKAMLAPACGFPMIGLLAAAWWARYGKRLGGVGPDAANP